MKIGLISDTHSFFDIQLRSYFSDCDEIWHAGDFGHTSPKNLKKKDPYVSLGI